MIIEIARDIDKRFYNVYRKREDKLFYMFTVFEDDLYDLVGDDAFCKIVPDAYGGFATLELTLRVL